MRRSVRLSGILGTCLGLVTMAAWGLSPAGATELGIDASVGIDDNEVGNARLVHFDLPGAPGIDGGIFQTFRVAFPAGRLGAIEAAPGLSIHSYTRDDPGVPKYSNTTTQIALAISYLRGRTEGKGAAPYARVGGQVRYRDATNQDGSSQVGFVVGGGLRWRMSNVIGVRSELSLARWLEGDYAAQWGGQLSVGISAFTK